MARLKVSLLGVRPTTATCDPHAYTLYLRASHLRRQNTSRSWDEAVTLCQQCLDQAPEYAPAWTLLATIYDLQTGQGFRDFAGGFALAREAATRALALDDKYPTAYARLGRIAMGEGDLENAARHFSTALQLLPTDLEILGMVASFTRAVGRLDAAITLREAVVQRDPLNPIGYYTLGMMYLAADNLGRARAAFDANLAMSPDTIGVQFGRAISFSLDRHPGEALAAALLEPDEGYQLAALALAHSAGDNQSASLEAIEKLIETHGTDMSAEIAAVYAYRNESDVAFAWLQRAAEQHDPGLSQITVLPLFSRLRQDARWEPFLRRIGRAPEQLAAIDFGIIEQIIRHVFRKSISEPHADAGVS